MRQSLLLFTLSVIIFISGCSIPETCVLYNNTGQDLKVIRIKTDGSKTERKLKARSTIKLGGWVFSTYQIITKDTTWNYEPEITDPGFVADTVFLERIFKAQLEKDGRIYILQPKQSFPASEFPEQPEGFPLLPK